MTIVRNPDYPNDEFGFSTSPREAVLGAFAMFTMRNANSFNWESLYGDRIQHIGKGWLCGSWFAHESGK